MHSPLQTLITLPLSDRQYIYIYIYLAKCLQGMNRTRKPQLKETDSAALRGSLTFKLNVSTRLSTYPNLFPTATPK